MITLRNEQNDVMEVEGPKGNPSAVPSHSLPPQAEAVTPADDDNCTMTPGSSKQTSAHTNSMGQPSKDIETERVPENSVTKEKDQKQAHFSQSSTTDNEALQQPAENWSSFKLCGYLLKQGGPLKAWKSRWFTYEEKKSQLFYYRTAQDVNPLGRVKLCCATFGYPLQGEPGTFHIHTPERTVILKAANQAVMMFWLQQLQLKRWQYRDQLTAESTQHYTDSHNGEEQGTTMGDELLTSSKWMVSIEGKVTHCIEEKLDYAAALSAVLGCFYVFNIEYLESASATLELIQRFFVRITTEWTKCAAKSGTCQKTGSTVRRKVQNINPHVHTFLQSLTKFEWKTSN